jgi:Tol biopolymer transport system component
VSLAGSQRVLAAQAQFQQGLLYERLGRKVEAQRAFSAVVSGFPDQKGVVALARAKLPPAPLEVGQKRVWTGTGVDTTGSISPDGRLLSFTDWDTGDLSVHDVETGENRHLTRNPRLPLEELQFANSSVFSRDGQWLAYVWYSPNNSTPMEVRVIGRDGSGQRTVFRNATGNGSWLRVDDWTNNRKSLLVITDDGTAKLLLISIADASSRVIPVSERWSGGWGKAVLSPDDQYIAYDAEQPDGTREVRTVGLGGGDAPLMATSNDDTLLGWSPDGSMLVFRSNLSGAYEIWGISVVKGRAQGSPQRLRSNADQFGTSFGITRQGTLFYAINTGAADVFLTDLDLASGALSPPKLLNQRFMGTKALPAWSPDGSTVAYVAKNMLRLHVMSTGEERDLWSGMSRFMRVLAWTPDGRSIFAQGQNTDRQNGTFRIDLNTGDTRMVLPYTGNPIAFSPDGNTVYLDGKQPRAIFSHDLLTREEKLLYTQQAESELDSPNLSISPDGRMLALQLTDVPRGYRSLAVMPVTGGEPHTILQIRKPELFGYDTFAWSPDMRYIFAARNPNGRAGIWRVPVDGSPPQSTGISTPGATRLLHLSPNGRQFVFVNARGSDEVWVLENFLPPVPPARPARR